MRRKLTHLLVSGIVVCLSWCIVLGLTFSKAGDAFQGRGTVPESPLRPWDYPKLTRLEVVATAYTNFDAGMDGKGITASGRKTQEYHTIATDPEVIPLGTWVYIPYFADTPSHGWYRAEDTGSDIKGMRIDVFMPIREVALKFGVKPLEIYVFEENANDKGNSRPAP